MSSLIWSTFKKTELVNKMCKYCTVSVFTARQHSLLCRALC